MKESPGVVALQLAFIALCAWGVVVALEIAALIAAMLLDGGGSLPSRPPSPVLVGAWLALTVRLVGLLRRRPA